MKKRVFIFTVIFILCLLSAANGSSYTLPEKMQKQLQVGSGLKGSFVIHSNADAEINPFIHAVQNAEFEIRGIQSGDDLHYYIYQPGEEEEMSFLTEFCRIGGTDYLRSDLLDGKVYLLPRTEQMINRYLHAEGENASILPDLIQIVLDDIQEKESSFSSDAFEKQIEVWMSSFATDITVQSGENTSPTLSQVYTIPVESVLNAITTLVQSVSSSEIAMTYLRSVLSEEQIDTYLNPNLGYYYLEAMNKLDLDGDIVFSKTVSTLGEMIHTSLQLPLDPDKTGYSSVTFESDEKNKSVFLTGTKGAFYLELPIDFDLSAESFESDIRLIYADTENREEKNVSLLVHLTKKYEKYDEEEESRTHETEFYRIKAEKDLSNLPEGIMAEQFSEFETTDAEIEIHYFSKLILSSPTTLEISCTVHQGSYNFILAGKVKTASPWVFTPFDVSDPVNAESYNKEDFDQIMNSWTENALKNFIRTPEEIKQAVSSDDSEI